MTMVTTVVMFNLTDKKYPDFKKINNNVVNVKKHYILTACY